MKNIRQTTILLLLVFLYNDLTYSNEPVFKQNEKLDFKIRYGFITAGSVDFVTSQANFLEEKVFHTKVTAKTTGFIDQLYKLHDSYESYYDIKTGFPRFSIINLSEGKYRYYNETTYNQNDLSAYSQRKDSVLSLKSQVFDIVSAIYYFRRLDWSNLAENDVVELQIFHEDSHFPMLVVYKGLENVSIGSSTYHCHKFMPVIDPGKIFQKKENMTIFFSADKNKIPVCIKLNLVVGAFRVELEQYKNLLYPFDAKIK